MRKLDLNMKFEFVVDFETNGKEITTCIITKEPLIDLLQNFCSEYLDDCVEYLNTGKCDGLEEVLGLFMTWVNMAKGVIKECYPILESTLTLGIIDLEDATNSLKTAREFIKFLEDMCGIILSKEVDGKMVYGSVLETSITNLSNYKELTITEAENLIRKRLRMNVVITGDV